MERIKTDSDSVKQITLQDEVSQLLRGLEEIKSLLGIFNDECEKTSSQTTLTALVRMAQDANMSVKLILDNLGQLK